MVPPFGLGPVHDDWVARSLQPDLPDMDGVVPVLDEHLGHAFRQVLVDEELQLPCRSGSSRSRSAAAAYRSASATSSASRAGKSAKISSTVIPSATIPTTVATGNRVAP